MRGLTTRRFAARGRFRAGAAALCAAGLLSGCLATTQEIEDLRVDIVHLQNALSKVGNNQAAYQTTLQGSQADVLSQMNTLSSKLEILSSHLDESDNRMTVLSDRLVDLDKNLTSRLDSLSEALAQRAESKSKGKDKDKDGGEDAGSAEKGSKPPAPSALYKQAYTDFTRRRYDVALEGFKAYLDRFPETEKAAEAQYHIGECYRAKGETSRALEAYDAVLNGYPKSPVVPSAYLQKAQSLEKQKKTSEAAQIYETIARKYPHRAEARTAEARLAALKGSEKPAK